MLFRNKVLEITSNSCYQVFSDKRKDGTRRVKFWGLAATPKQIEQIKALSDHILKIGMTKKSYRGFKSLSIVLDCKLGELHENHIDGKFYTIHELNCELGDMEKCNDEKCSKCNATPTFANAGCCTCYYNNHIGVKPCKSCIFDEAGGFSNWKPKYKPNATPEEKKVSNEPTKDSGTYQFEKTSDATVAINVSDQDSVVAAIKQMVAFLPAGTVCTLEIPVNRVDVVKIINE